MHTTYKPVGGFPGYEVGDDGSVWVYWPNSRSTRERRGDWWFRLKPCPADNGYLRVNLKRGTKYVTKHVARLVLEAFVGPAPAGHEACHSDGSRTNNALSNLRWDSRRGNASDRPTHGTDKRGTKSFNAKLTSEDVQFIRAQPRGEVSHKALAAKFNVSVWTVANIRRTHSTKWAWLTSEGKR